MHLQFASDDASLALMDPSYTYGISWQPYHLPPPSLKGSCHRVPANRSCVDYMVRADNMHGDDANSSHGVAFTGLVKS
jgi:hypothetical protein